ncbi:MAG: NAD-glutamate dehydrogenase [Halofilum sp. (in: g-proteobacteria)]
MGCGNDRKKAPDREGDPKRSCGPGRGTRGSRAINTTQRRQSAGAFGALIKYLRENAGNRSVDLLEPLARLLFHRGIPEEFSRQSSQTLNAMLQWAHDFALERAPGESKVRILEPTAERDGWELPYALVAVVTDDRPFLVDSIRMALSENEVSIDLVMHPQLMVWRDQRGRLTQLLGRNHSPELSDQALSESLMLFWVERPVTEALSNRLVTGINTALEDVDAAVSDFEPMRARARALIDEYTNPPVPMPEEDVREVREFLDWLVNDHFTFLGYREYRVGRNDGDRVLKLDAKSGLGVLRGQRKKGRMRSVSALEKRLRDFADTPVPLVFTKTDARSTVHRRGHMDYIGVLRYDENGNIIGECRFVGLYTSGTYHRSAWDIPFIRGKANAVMQRSGIPPDSHDGKALVNILESLPRDELFQSTIDELLDTALGVLDLEERNRTRLFVRRDHVAQFFSCLVFIPRERFNTDVRLAVQAILREALGGAREDFTLQFGEAGMVRVHYIVRPEGPCSENYDVGEIEERIVTAVRSWHDDLREILIERHGERRGMDLAKRFRHAMPTVYTSEVLPSVAAFDVEKIDSLGGPDDIGLSLYRPADDASGIVRFKVFKHDHTIPLSDAMPMLERMGLRAVSEWGPYDIRMPNGDHICIQDLDLTAAFTDDLDVSQVREPFAEAFEQIWRGRAESDGFNRLILAAHMNWRQAALLRAYCKYLIQTGVPFSQTYMEETLTRHPLISRLLIELFEARLEPARDREKKRDRERGAKKLRATFDALVSGEPGRVIEDAIERLAGGRVAADREAQQGVCREVLEELLDEVSSLDEDRILRAFADLIDATLRTNAFQTDTAGQWHDYMSFKFDCSRVPDLPKPRPFREIFVYSPRVEGVHLRGGRVARGGLRWSDRREDFRTEVLGLMKAQTVKNTMIVPVGAKGGFVPKQLPAGGNREAIQKEGIACYRIFIRGLLDITDNLVKGEIVHPEDVVRHDEPDPYLVVAADKGTATFSDYANELSKGYGFWLGDAFASGGSNGYDHKGMGITAKGAWESVKRHFRELGIDCQNEEHTAVGVGDMAGDVFGNGMLLSKHTRLIAAFNHLHIFIDPDPDTAVAYKERQRLFKNVAGWGEYDQKKISKGGGVWERSVKSIKLPKEARDALGIEATELAPYQIVAAIMRAQVDLVWLGGIGTYLKGSNESEEEVGDRANRLVRCNGNELRCRIVGEGANLGCTQKGRIEFALNGGYINTDFIDNSAGVDCSDHEVNIKILLNAAVDAGKLTESKRSAQLSAMTDEVGQLVLRNNYLQTQAISMMSAFTVSRLGTKAHFISWLEGRGLLDRQLEALPNQEQIEERQSQGLGLTRPEIAVLLSYAKITLYPELLESDVPEDPYLARELVDYFPTDLREAYRGYMKEHRVWREIIATQVTNSVINRMGATFILRMQEDTSATPAEVARAFTIAREVFDAPSIWAGIEALDTKVDSRVQTDLLLRLWELLRHATRWLLNRPGHQLDIADSVDAYRPGVQQFVKHLDGIAVESWCGAMDELVDDLSSRGVPKDLARRIAVIDALYPSLDIVDIANTEKRQVEQVGRLYALLGERFGLTWLRTQIETLPVDGAWHANARGALRDDLYDQHRALTVRLLNARGEDDPDAAVEAWFGDHAMDADRVQNMMAEIQRVARVDYATAVVALRALGQLVTETGV